MRFALLASVLALTIVSVMTRVQWSSWSINATQNQFNQRAFTSLDILAGKFWRRSRVEQHGQSVNHAIEFHLLTVANDAESLRRMEDFLEQVQQYDRIRVVPFSVSKDTDYRINFESMLQRCIDSDDCFDDKHVIFSEDDAVMISGFPQHLEQTIQDLPDDWTLLHLCPGFLTGHAKPSHKLMNWTFHGQMDVEDEFVDEVRNATRTNGGRAFPVWPVKKQGWAGGPASVLVRNAVAAKSLVGFLHNTGKSSALDVSFTKHARRIGANGSSSICTAAFPQLCYHAFTPSVRIRLSRFLRRCLLLI